MLAVDHSSGGVLIGAALSKAGLVGVVRYAAGGRTNVNISAAEYADLNRHGIFVAIVLEHEADWLLRGGVSGRVAASLEVTRAAGVPDGVTFMAADFDATLGGPTSPGSPGDRNMQKILAALNEAASVIGEENVGFYGSYFACDWLSHNAHWLKYYWSTEAWSQGKGPHPLACLYQRAQSEHIAGVDCDLDDVLRPEWGQRVHSHSVSTVRASGTFRALVEYDHDSRQVRVTPQSGDVKTWGTVDEWIRLGVDLRVGPNHPGQWRGEVLGTSTH